MMTGGPLFQQDYQPRFTGHETFPLRYGWLKKAHDRVIENEQKGGDKTSCWGDDAIAHFGVGKNMVASMRHWAKAVGVIEEPSGENKVVSTPLGKFFFGEKGADPYLEHPTSLWIIHWELATAWKSKTTLCWAFNYYPDVTFERDGLTRRLVRVSKEQGWSRASEATIKSDVACFIRTYTAQPASAKTGRDDSLESPLTELGLVKRVSKRDEFRFVRGRKSTLSDGAFLYALVEYWRAAFSDKATMSFELLVHKPGSPGRIFQLDENDVAEKLSAIEDVSGGGLRVSETAGLRQVVKKPDFSLDSDILSLAGGSYSKDSITEAA